MPEYTIKNYTYEQRQADLKQELKRDGLCMAVARRLDEIDQEAHALGYMGYGTVQEKSIEIMELLMLDENERMGETDA